MHEHHPITDPVCGPESPACDRSGRHPLPLLQRQMQNEIRRGAGAEYRDFRRRFWLSLPLTVTVVGLAMAGHRLEGLPPPVRTWGELLLSLPIVLWAGAPFFVRGWQSLIQRSPDKVQ